MSSVRSRIDKFEALSREDSEIKTNNNELSKKGKRFQFPGNNTLNTEADPSSNFIPISRSPKRYGIQNFEADLQEVWSVKKNIHHTGNQKNISSSTSSNGLLSSVPGGPGAQAIAGQYSRHGAINAQPSRGSQIQPASNRDHFGRGSSLEPGAAESRRIPLQDFNSKDSAWNVKKGGYSYNLQNSSNEGTAKRSIGSPKATDPSLLPAAKRRINRGSMEVIRPAADNSPATSFVVKEVKTEKVGYAKKMAQGYLKSMGMGEYTPSGSMYHRQDVKPAKSNSTSSSSASAATRWKRVEVDDKEFEFDA